MAKIFIDQSAVKRMSAPGQMLDVFAGRLAEQTRSRARQLIKRGEKEPGLAASLKIARAGTPAGQWVVWSDEKYAAAHHEGSRAHPIFAGSKGLHFLWKNQGGLETFVPKPFRVNKKGVRIPLPTRGLTRRPSRSAYINSRGQLIILKGFVNIPAMGSSPYLTRALQEVIPRR